MYLNYVHLNCPGSVDPTTNVFDHVGMDLYCRGCETVVPFDDMRPILRRLPALGAPCAACGKRRAVWKALETRGESGVILRGIFCDEHCGAKLPDSIRLPPDTDGWCSCTGKKHVKGGIHCRRT